MRSASQFADLDATASQTSIIYVQDKKKFSDISKFIKRLGDERVSCQVMITVKEFKV